MSYTFINRPAVRADIIEATSYYKNINPNLATQFLLRIREAKSAIEQNPLGFEIRYKGVRTYLLKQFPYHIYYSIDEVNKRIAILAIIHAHKNPKDYSNR